MSLSDDSLHHTEHAHTKTHEYENADKTDGNVRKESAPT